MANKNLFSNMVIDRVSDADLQTKLEGVEFSTTPREVVTVRDMEKHYYEITEEDYIRG